LGGFFSIGSFFTMTELAQTFRATVFHRKKLRIYLAIVRLGLHFGQFPQLWAIFPNFGRFFPQLWAIFFPTLGDFCATLGDFFQLIWSHCQSSKSSLLKEVTISRKQREKKVLAGKRKKTKGALLLNEIKKLLTS
jgi:hypothetical protein